jgi:hypothetical protein
MRRQITRRAFIRYTASILPALALPPFPNGSREVPLPDDVPSQRTLHQLGRITTGRLNIHAEPDVGSSIVGYRGYDDLVTIDGAAHGPGMMRHNSLWFQTSDGYLYSSFVQPVARRWNHPLLPHQIDENQPALLEVSAPYVSVYRSPAANGRRVYRLYYATTHWAVAVERDQGDHSWYRLRNDRGFGHYYVRAEWMRPVPRTELKPIAPDVMDKRIEINLTQQHLKAFQENRVVLSTPVSTGAVFGGGRDFRTPVGQFRVWRKRASRHMRGGTPGIDWFDLPGVPWVSYFTGGIALHGTYWHNDYGRQRSHGCVNLTPEHARWLYRWTDPAVPPDTEILDASVTSGTRIVVYR